MAIAVLTTTVTYFFVVLNVFPVPAVLCLGIVALVLTPTARGLARRVSVNIAVLIGWSPLLWWVPWPFPFNHGAFVFAAAIGGCAAASATALRRDGWAGGLLPRVRPLDGMLVGSLVLALWFTYQWVFPGTSIQALNLLYPAWDNHVHFSIFTTLLENNATTEVAGSAADGSPWASANYPTGFHALAATCAQLASPDQLTGAEALVAYTRACSIVVIIGVVMLTGAICSLPGLTNRPAVAVPAVVTVWVAFLWTPGHGVLSDGFVNFWLAATAAASALLLAVWPERRRSISDAAAVGGLLIAVTHSWAPLLAMVGTAGLVVMVPLRGWRDFDKRTWSYLAVLFLATLGLLRGLESLLDTVEVTSLVTAMGGISTVQPVPTLLLALAALLLFPGYKGLVKHHAESLDDQAAASRVALLGLSPLLGLGLLALLFVAQISEIGRVAYYFLKYMTGVELVLAAVVPAVLAMLIVAVTPRLPRLRIRSWLGLGSVLLAILMVFEASHLAPTALAKGGRGTVSLSGYSLPDITWGVIQAAESSTDSKSFNRVYVPLGDGVGPSNPVLQDGWYHAIDRSLTHRVVERWNAVDEFVTDPETAANLIETMLRKDSTVKVIVDPIHLHAVRASLSSSQLRKRVTTW